MENYKFKESIIENQEFSNITCENQTLEEMKFIDIKFQNVDFSGSIFKETLLEKVEAQNVNFEKCQIESDQMDFSGQFTQCNFKDAQIKYIRFEYAVFSDCNFQSLGYEYGTFSDCIFKNCDMSELIFNETSFWGEAVVNSCFVKAKLEYSGFDYLQMENNNFSMAVKNGGGIGSTVCKNCLFKGTIFSNEYFDNSKMIECDFEDAKLSETTVISCEFSDCKFANTEIVETGFEGCTFNNIDFTKTNIQKVTFDEYCKFENVMFTEAQKAALGLN